MDNYDDQAHYLRNCAEADSPSLKPTHQAVDLKSVLSNLLSLTPAHHRMLAAMLTDQDPSTAELYCNELSQRLEKHYERVGHVVVVDGLVEVVCSKQCCSDCEPVFKTNPVLLPLCALSISALATSL